MKVADLIKLAGISEKLAHKAEAYMNNNPDRHPDFAAHALKVFSKIPNEYADKLEITSLPSETDLYQIDTGLIIPKLRETFLGDTEKINNYIDSEIVENITEFLLEKLEHNKKVYVYAIPLQIVTLQVGKDMPKICINVKIKAV